MVAIDACASTSKPRSFAFVFGQASGHINPSLPVARTLVNWGHEVHFLTRPQMREAVEGTGAKFHSDLDWLSELYEDREPDIYGAFEALKHENGIPEDPFCNMICKLRTIANELMVPGMLRWLQSIRADAVMYCPMLNAEAVYGAELLGLESVGLLTTAGPGSLERSFEEFMAACGQTVEGIKAQLEVFEPHRAACKRFQEKYGIHISPMGILEPLGKISEMDKSYTTLVTTCDDLQDPMTPELEEAYERAGTRFEAVGPLLDEEGAKRCAGHTLSGAAAVTGSDEVVTKLREAKAAGRKAVLVSMGTVITGDQPVVGWKGLFQDADGNFRGLTGKQLCQAAWRGAFDAFGEASEEEGALILVSLGPQPDALEGLTVPPNAICLPVLPQVDLLRIGVDLFLTHGGQNSFTESLSCATPVVVCPGGGDQIVNARKAQALGVGLEVPRPFPEVGEEEQARNKYRSDVTAALKAVIASEAFSSKASECAERLRRCGGVVRAAEVMLEAADRRKQNLEVKLPAVGGA